MINEASRLVTEDNGPRPAGPPDQCFYCDQPIGANHKDDCVLWAKTVLVTLHVPLVIGVPQHWTKERIELYINESRSCFANRLHDLNLQAERMGDKCLCGMADASYEREATEEDERRFCWHWSRE